VACREWSETRDRRIRLTPHLVVAWHAANILGLERQEPEAQLLTDLEFCRTQRWRGGRDSPPQRRNARGTVGASRSGTGAARDQGSHGGGEQLRPRRRPPGSMSERRIVDGRGRSFSASGAEMQMQVVFPSR
jgi:hypothetical protein